MMLSCNRYDFFFRETRLQVFIFHLRLSYKSVDTPSVFSCNMLLSFQVDISSIYAITVTSIRVPKCNTYHSKVVYMINKNIQ